MIGEEKLNDELFWVQDLRKMCPTCHQPRKDIATVHDDGFSFHWLVAEKPNVRMIDETQIRDFEDHLSGVSGTIITHARCDSLTRFVAIGDFTPSPNIISNKPKYKIGRPTLTLPVDIDKIVSGCDRIFANNLYENLHDKIYPLPLGFCRKEITDFIHLRQKDKENFCYANFSLTQKYRFNVLQWAAVQDDIDCHFTKRFPDWDDQIDDKYFSEPLPFDEFISTLASYKFCIAPNGVGIDTDRLWECIFLNTVPIVQNNYGNRVFSKIWPMILVDRYEFADIPKLAEEFETQHGECIQYNHDLLLRKNLPELLDRIEYECKRLDE